MTLNRTSIDYHHISSKERKYLEMIEGVRRLKLKDIVKGEELAEGSCGTIFKSKIRDETGNWIEAALKVIKPKCHKPREKMLWESIYLSKLQGVTGVPILYGIRDTKNEAAIAMSYVCGKELHYHFMHHRNVPMICGVLAKVAKILKDIHERGMGHNDIHAGNVMVIEPTNGKKDPYPMLIDFGCCNYFGSVLFSKPLPPLFDTFHYDPLISRDCGPTSPQTDIYSFAKLVKDTVKPRDRSKLDGLIRRALSPDETQRPFLEDFIRALTNIQKGIPDDDEEQEDDDEEQETIDSRWNLTRLLRYCIQKIKNCFEYSQDFIIRYILIRGTAALLAPKRIFTRLLN